MSDGIWSSRELVLLARNQDGADIGRFPLTHTAADARVSGWLASTQLTQTFQNPFDQAVEAVYLLPLPGDAAVNEFQMEIGDRTVVGIVRPREEAEAIYAEARRSGRTASLLTQERPNLFTQSVANIAPGSSLDVRVTFFHGLRYEGGAYEYMLPTTVMPRYGSGGRAAGAPSPETDDAGSLAMPEREGRRPTVALQLRIDAGLTIRAVESPTHTLRTTVAGHRADVALADEQTHPDSDIVVRWHVAQDDVTPGVLAHRTQSTGGFFTAFLVPSLDPSAGEVGAREVTFVIDTSGSMRGVPMASSKRLITRAIADMRPYDRLNVIQFAGSTGSFAAAPVEATPENRAAATEYVDTLSGGGGTEMLAGIQHWLDQPQDPRYLRTVVFLTDGAVSGEESILATVRDQGQDARWFAFGIGSSVNRYLIQGIADHGRGAAEVVVRPEADAADAAADRLRARFDAPLLLDVRADANGLPISDLQMPAGRDLFAGQPLVVTGRYVEACRGELLIRGTVAGREVTIPVTLDLPESEPENAALAAVWARTRVARLDGELLGTEGDRRVSLLRRIEDLGTEFRLVTRRTSFVAVDDDGGRVGDGFPVRILMASELPRGVRYWGEAAALRVERGVRISAWGLTLAEARSGELTVAVVEQGSRAQRAGLSHGVVVESVDGLTVKDASHFRRLVQHSEADDVRLGYRHGAGRAVRETVLSRR